MAILASYLLSRVQVLLTSSTSGTRPLTSASSAGSDKIRSELLRKGMAVSASTSRAATGPVSKVSWSRVASWNTTGMWPAAHCRSTSMANPAPMAPLTEEALFSTMPLDGSCKPRWAIGRFNQ